MSGDVAGSVAAWGGCCEVILGAGVVIVEYWAPGHGMACLEWSCTFNLQVKGRQPRMHSIIIVFLVSRDTSDSYVYSPFYLQGEPRQNLTHFSSR